MTGGFDARALDVSYAFLDRCPPALFDRIVTMPQGTLPARVESLAAWRDALLAGTDPPPTPWPPPEIAGPARATLVELGLARFCKGQPDLVDAILADVLDAFTRAGATVRAALVARMKELREAEDAGTVPRSDSRRRRREALRLVRAASSDPDATLWARWQPCVAAWTELADVFGDLGHLLGRGWDLSTGIVRHAGWTDLLQLRRLLAQVPQLRQIVQTLGRLQLRDDGPSVTDVIVEPIQRVVEEVHEVHVPDVPADIRGIVRGDDLARMLPVEAAQLGHPVLRLLWHARRAERALLGYRVEGVEIVRSETVRVDHVETARERPRPERGPIIAVVDTSGSMEGLPERLAKALVLEALRIAHAEKRRCFLYLYGGPGEVAEHELDLSIDGVGRLLVFLSLTFGNGTDIGALRSVLCRLAIEEWKKADVMVVSDGVWQAPADVVRDVAAAVAQGTRFHGVQIGGARTSALRTLCDPVHELDDLLPQ